MGHLQYLPVSEPGLAYAAAVSWCLDTNRDLDLRAALDVHVFDDPAGEIGGAMMALGDLHRVVTPQFPNLSMLVTAPVLPAAAARSRLHRRADDRRAGGGGGAARGHDRQTLDRARPRRADGALVLDELRNAIALVALLSRDGRARLEGDGWLASVPAPTPAGSGGRARAAHRRPPEPLAGAQPARRTRRQLRVARPPAAVPTRPA